MRSNGFAPNTRLSLLIAGGCIVLAGLITACASDRDPVALDEVQLEFGETLTDEVIHTLTQDDDIVISATTLDEPSDRPEDLTHAPARDDDITVVGIRPDGTADIFRTKSGHVPER